MRNHPFVDGNKRVGFMLAYIFLVRNGCRVLHKVSRCLSLGTGQAGSRSGKQIGRINYAELGIVQLGSVYEGLLSYKGFFATEDLIQVLQAPTKKGGEQPVVYDDDIDPKMPTWFVPRTRLCARAFGLRNCRLP